MLRIRLGEPLFGTKTAPLKAGEYRFLFPAQISLAQRAKIDCLCRHTVQIEKVSAESRLFKR